MEELERVKEKVAHVCGYEVPDGDDSLIEYMLTAKRQYVCNACNTTSVPSGAQEIVVELVAGEYLLMLDKKQLFSEDDMQVVTSIKEGDVSISMSGESPMQRLQSVISYLLRERDFSCWRKMVW